MNPLFIRLSRVRDEGESILFRIEEQNFRGERWKDCFHLTVFGRKWSTDGNFFLLWEAENGWRLTVGSFPEINCFQRKVYLRGDMDSNDFEELRIPRGLWPEVVSAIQEFNLWAKDKVLPMSLEEEFFERESI